MKIARWIVLLTFGGLLFTTTCQGPTEPEYIEREEAIDIVIMEILKGDTTRVERAKISKKIVPPNTMVVSAEPQVITPGYKTWIVYINYGPISEDEFDIQWVIINAKTGDYYIIDHWYLRWNIEIKYIAFIG